MDNLIGYQAFHYDAPRPLRAESKLVQTRLGLIECAVVGSGPAVLISHGTPGGFDSGLVIAELLEESGCSFIAASRPGYLRTPLSVGCSPEDQADAFAALLDELRIRRAAMVGVNGGGPAALQFVLR